MATQKPLMQMSNELAEHFNRFKSDLEYNHRIYRILEGQIRPEVEDSMRREILSPSALRRALERIPSVNVLKKAVDKLAKVYSHHPMRYAVNKTDMDILNSTVRNSDLNNIMSESNRLYNAQNGCAVEPYPEKGQIKLRILGLHQFLVYSDDPSNPNKPTVFMKLMGKEMKTIEHDRIDSEGRLNKDINQIVREVDIIHVWSDSEFMIMDSGGTVRTDKMAALGLSPINELGVLPFIYINKSKHELVPFPNVSGLDISVLIPKLLADLNYAAQFLSHSIIFTRNADLQGHEINPDVIVNLGDGNENGQPDLDTINPQTDIPGVLQLIEFQLASYFSSIGIKSSPTTGQLPGREASGVSKAIDEGDATSEIRRQVEMYREVEHRLWNLLAAAQNSWSMNGLLEDRRSYSSDFIKTLTINFGEMKPLETLKSKIERVQMLKSIGLISDEDAIREIFPHFTEGQVQNWLKSIKTQREDNMAAMIPDMPGDPRSARNNPAVDDNEESAIEDDQER